MRKIPFFAYMPIVFVAGVLTLSDLASPAGSGFLSVLVGGIAALPWIIVVMKAANPVSDRMGYLLIWACIALNVAALAYFGWRKLKVNQR